MRDGLVFAAASAVAAALNYLYQVLASRQLSPMEFANLSGWVANLAPLFVLGSLLQYQANFNPATRVGLRLTGVGASLLVIPALFGWWQLPDSLGVASSLMIGLFAALVSWQMGQLQIRLHFKLMAAASIIIAGSRVVITLWPGLTAYDLNLFVFSNLASSAITLWILTAVLWFGAEVEKEKNQRFWQKAIILSLAGALIPQFDMLLMNHTQERDVFVAFAQASLFGRAAYALTMIFAAWLLPHQIRGHKLSAPWPMSLVIAALFAGSAGVAWLSPLIAQTVFGWEVPPSPMLVFLASAELSVLAVLFVKIQSACARSRINEAGLYMAILFVEAILQWILRLPAQTFLALALTAQTLTVLGVWRSDK